jgi:hypothetical protein
MTDLRTLLHDAAAEPTRALDLAALAARARRHRWRRLAIWLGSLGVLMGGTFGAPFVLQPSSPDRTSVGIDEPGEPNVVTNEARPSHVVVAGNQALAPARGRSLELPGLPLGSGGATEPMTTKGGPVIAWVEAPKVEDNGPIHVLDPVRNTDRIVAYGEMPSFSPDRQRMVYFVTPADPDCGGGVVCPAPGTYVKTLNDAGPGRRISQYGEFPEWSPTDDRIVFTKYGSDANANGELQLQVYVINADGSGERRLTDSMTRTAADPSWSPDGSKIAFCGEDNGYAAVGSVSSAVYVMNADGSALHAVAGTSDVIRSHTWSPDGKRIAFSAYQDMARQRVSVRVVDVATGDVVPLTDDWDAGFPAWSPNGTTIAFARGVTGPYGAAPYANASLWLMNTDGSNRRQVLAPSPNGISFISYSR